MADSTPRGIQATLFDYFQDIEYFDLQEANELLLEHQQRDINAESIRARIYEGIDKGLFERVGKGLYTVTRKDEQGRENTCLLINGDGRDLSIFQDNSLDAIITDHPYQLTASLKGGNRNFADYELFQYNEQDFKEKHRVLKPGRFLVEFLPEENADNYQYLFKVKEMARKAGMEYYAKVAWKKGDFVANTGRKSKNAEDICFFTKGRARELRPDAKKDKAEPGVAHYMSGAHGMLPTNFDVAPPSKKNRLHQAEKPVDLLIQILEYVTLPGETALDQFAGSGVLGEAALTSGRNSILIEKDVETFGKIVDRLQTLGSIEAISPASQSLISIGTNALVAIDAFNRTGDRNILSGFVESHEIPNPAVLYDGEKDVWNAAGVTNEQKDAVTKALNAIEEIDLRAHGLDLPQQDQEALDSLNPSENGVSSTKVLECSSRGDKRFSALYAMVTIKGKEQSIEEWYQNARRSSDGKRAGKGKPCDHIICPFTGDKLPAKDAADLYRGLWITYLSNNPNLVEYASQFDEFINSFKGNSLDTSPDEVIGAYVKGNRDFYVESVRAGHWYRNMAGKKKASLSSQIQAAQTRSVVPNENYKNDAKKAVPER